jgi:hypothetical protein
MTNDEWQNEGSIVNRRHTRYGAVITCVAVFLCVGFTRADARDDSNSTGKSPSQVAKAVGNIGLIKSLPPKSGEPQVDTYAAAIVSQGKAAGPFLVGKLTDDTRSECFDLFQYRVCDIANSLLCAIYRRNPSIALVARQPPLDAGQGYYYRDYAALTGSREGREALKDAWQEIVAKSGENREQSLGSLEEFKAELAVLKRHPLTATCSSDEIAKLKRRASGACLPEDSWAEILQLWVAGEYDFVLLLWWQKDDTETRAFIVSLDWCMVAIPEKDSTSWPGAVKDYEGMAKRFEAAERSLRLREADFVRQNHPAIAKEMSTILSAAHIEFAERYKAVAETRSNRDGQR